MTPAEISSLTDSIIREVRRRGPDPLALSETEAAKLLSLSSRTLYAMRQAGTIPHAKLGGRIVYPLAELRAWLSERTEKPSA